MSFPIKNWQFSIVMLVYQRVKVWSQGATKSLLTAWHDMIESLNRLLIMLARDSIPWLLESYWPSVGAFHYCNCKKIPFPIFQSWVWNIELAAPCCLMSKVPNHDLIKSINPHLHRTWNTQVVLQLILAVPTQGFSPKQLGNPTACQSALGCAGCAINKQ